MKKAIGLMLMTYAFSVGAQASQIVSATLACRADVILALNPCDNARHATHDDDNNCVYGAYLLLDENNKPSALKTSVVYDSHKNPVTEFTYVETEEVFHRLSFADAQVQASFQRAVEATPQYPYCDVSHRTCYRLDIDQSAYALSSIVISPCESQK